MDFRLPAVVALLVTLFVAPALSQTTPHPAPANAIFPAGAPCPEVPSGVPSNACYNFNGNNHVCCINPDSCGLLDASGGATCAAGRYALNQPTPTTVPSGPTGPTFTLIGKDPLCPVCQGAPSNPCFSSYGDAKVCCVNPNSCAGNVPATCTNNDYVQFTGSFNNPTAVNC